MQVYKREDARRLMDVPPEVEKGLPPTDPWMELRKLEIKLGVRITSWVAGTYTACAILAIIAIIELSLLGISLVVCFLSSFLVAYLLSNTHRELNDGRMYAILISNGADQSAIQSLSYNDMFEVTNYTENMAYLHNMLAIWIIYSLLASFIYLVSLKLIWAGWLVYGATLALLCFFCYIFFKHDINSVMTGVETAFLKDYLSENRHLLKKNVVQPR